MRLFITFCLPIYTLLLPKYGLHIILISLLDVRYVVEGKNLTCQVPSVKRMAPTSLTCYFPEDVNQTKKDITVYHHKSKDDNKSDTPDFVLEYFWVNGKLLWMVQPGYEFNGEATDKLEVKIPNSSETFTGTYSCHISGYPAADIDTCLFTFKQDNKVVCNVTSTKLKGGTTMTCLFPEDVSHTKKDIAVYHFGRSDTSVAVVDCKWHKNNINCTSQPGYRVLTAVPSDHFIIGIPETPESQTVSYQCYMDRLRPDDASFCTFHVQEENGACHFDSFNVTVPIISILGLIVVVVLVKKIKREQTWTDQSELRVKEAEPLFKRNLSNAGSVTPSQLNVTSVTENSFQQETNEESAEQLWCRVQDRQVHVQPLKFFKNPKQHLRK